MAPPPKFGALHTILYEKGRGFRWTFLGTVKMVHRVVLNVFKGRSERSVGDASHVVSEELDENVNRGDENWT